MSKKKAEWEGKTSEGSGLSEGFKIVLTTVTLDENYKALRVQFFKKVKGKETENLPSTKIDDGCFLAPYKVFTCRLFTFGSIYLDGLWSLIFFYAWMIMRFV